MTQHPATAGLPSLCHHHHRSLVRQQGPHLGSGKFQAPSPAPRSEDVAHTAQWVSLGGRVTGWRLYLKSSHSGAVQMWDHEDQAAVWSARPCTNIVLPSACQTRMDLVPGISQNHPSALPSLAYSGLPDCPGRWFPSLGPRVHLWSPWRALCVPPLVGLLSQCPWFWHCCDCWVTLDSR